MNEMNVVMCGPGPFGTTHNATAVNLPGLPTPSLLQANEGMHTLAQEGNGLTSDDSTPGSWNPHTRKVQRTETWPGPAGADRWWLLSFFELTNRRASQSSRIQVWKCVLDELVASFKLKDLNPGVCVHYFKNIDDLFVYKKTSRRCFSLLSVISYKRSSVLGALARVSFVLHDRAALSWLYGFKIFTWLWCGFKTFSATWG